MTPVEMAAVFAVGGSVLAVAAPTFLRDLHASRTSEAIDGIHRIAARSVALSEGREIAASFPQPAPLTPAEIPRGRSVTDPPGTWDHPTWKELEFSFSNAHYYAFQYNVATEPARIWFQAIAQGDLNGDGGGDGQTADERVGSCRQIRANRIDEAHAQQRDEARDQRCERHQGRPGAGAIQPVRDDVPAPLRHHGWRGELGEGEGFRHDAAVPRQNCPSEAQVPESVAFVLRVDRLRRGGQYQQRRPDAVEGGGVAIRASLVATRGPRVAGGIARSMRTRGKRG